MNRRKKLFEVYDDCLSKREDKFFCIKCYITEVQLIYCYKTIMFGNFYTGGVKMNTINCPECGKEVDAKSYSMVCDYCLSKRED